MNDIKLGNSEDSFWVEYDSSRYEEFNFENNDYKLEVSPHKEEKSKTLSVKIIKNSPSVVYVKGLDDETNVKVFGDFVSLYAEYPKRNVKFQSKFKNNTLNIIPEKSKLISVVGKYSNPADLNTFMEKCSECGYAKIPGCCPRNDKLPENILNSDNEKMTTFAPPPGCMACHGSDHTTEEHDRRRPKNDEAN